MRPQVMMLVLLSGMAGSSQRLLGDSFNFNTIDVPGSSSTMASGINNLGQIVGTFHDGSGSHGFLDTNGTFIPINFPGGANTTANGINDLGGIVGTYVETQTFSYLYNNGAFTHLVIPPPGPIFSDVSAQAFDINNSGQIVGSHAGFIGTTIPGFIYNYNNGVFTDITGFKITQPYGINNAGQVVGGLLLNGSGFLYNNGVITTTNVPGALSTQFDGINDSGEIIGQICVGSPGTSFLPCLGVTQSFLYVNGTFEPIDVPGATKVFAMGINNAGQIVGGYDDSNGNLHGFLATPIPEPASLFLLAAGIAALGFWKVRKRLWADGHSGCAQSLESSPYSPRPLASFARHLRCQS